MSRLATYLMFEGRAEEAMTLYVSLFPNSRVDSVERYGADGPGPAGSIKHARFTLNGHAMGCGDTFVKHAFTFTPSVSLFHDCDDEAELDRLVATLNDGGQFLMPPDNYGFSRKFAWTADRFGVSWQLNLP